MAKSRAENILTAMINQTPYAEYPQSRLEDLLLQLKEVYEQGGGGSTPTAADVSYDNTTSGMTADDVQDAIDEVFQSVSSGKTLVAGAITDKGVTTSASDTFATMAANIAAIPTGGACVLANYYDNDPNFYANEVHKFTAQMDGTCTFVYYQVCRQTDPAVTVNGTAKSVKTARLQNNQTPAWGIWIYEFEVETGDEVTITFNFQGGQNNNHVEFILATISGSADPGSEVYTYEIGGYSGTVAKTTQIQHSGTLSCMMIDELHSQAATMTVNGTDVTASVQQYYQGVGYDYFETQVSVGDTVVVTYYGNGASSTRSVILMTVDY